MIQYFQQNMAGRDFVIGDIHGRLPELQRAMKSVGFDKCRDRLFALGDLVNKGDYSQEVVGLLGESWFFSIRGNHDQIIMDCFTRIQQGGQFDGQCDPRNKWYYTLPPAQQLAIYNRLAQLPIAIELETPFGFVGMVHAEVPYRISAWQRYLKFMPLQPELQHESMYSHDAINDIYHSKEEVYLPMHLRTRRNVMGINATVHGHTPVPEPVIGGNQMWIDTFKKTGELCILEATKVLQMVQGR